MTDSKKLRIGIIGAGTNTKLRHIPGFQALEGVSVEVVCNRSEASSKKAAEEFGIPRIAGTWQEVVEDPEIDAICIGTWPYLHAEISIAALRQGKHVLTEARMAMDSAEAEAMLAASLARPDLVAQIVPSPFTLKWDATIEKIVRSGEIGELREAYFHKTLPLNVDETSPLNWRQDREYSGKNVLMLGIYYEAIRRWLGIAPNRVWADGAIFTSIRRDAETGLEKEIRIPETLTFLAKYGSGLRLSGTMTGIEQGRGSDFMVVIGSLGSVKLDLSTGTLTKAVLGAEETVVEPRAEDVGEWNVEADFVASIRSGKPVELTSFERGLEYMKFTDAVIGSIEAGGIWVDY